MRMSIETSWNVITLCGYCSFVIFYQYSIFTSILYGYLDKLSGAASPIVFGLLLATHGIGHFIAAILFPLWASAKGVQPPLVTGFSLMCVANCLHIIAEFMPLEVATALMFVNRLFAGAGMGMSYCLRATVCANAKRDDQSATMSTFMSCRAAGLVAGPALELAWILLLHDPPQRPFAIHMYNAPAVVSIILNVSAIVIAGFFIDNICYKRDDTPGMDFDDVNYPTPDRLTVFVCTLTRYAQNFTIFAIETMTPIIIMMMFDMNRHETVASFASVLFVSGLIALGIYLVFIFTKTAQMLNIGKINSAVFLIIIVFLVVTYQWQFLTDSVPMATKDRPDSGCDADSYKWCHELTPTFQTIFYIGFIITFGAITPFINITDATLYSALFNPLGHVSQQHLFDISLLFGRLVAPLVCTIVYHFYGPRRVWEVIVVQLIVVTILWLIFAKRMITLRPKTRPIFYLE